MEIQTRYGDIAVLYEDNHLLVAVKPPNLPSQADKSGDSDMLSLLKDYIARKYAKPGEVYLGLVHRLDRPVGGVMVFARTSKAAARLSAQFAEHSAGKTYLAVLEAELKTALTLENYILQKQGQNVRVFDSEAGGARFARLHSRPICVKDALTLTKVTLETGRKHQIRAQHAHAGYPIWGDNRYGHGRSGQQIALWAYALTLEHPTRREEMTFTAPPPDKYPWNKFTDEIKELLDETPH